MGIGINSVGDAYIHLEWGQRGRSHSRSGTKLGIIMENWNWKIQRRIRIACLIPWLLWPVGFQGKTALVVSMWDEGMGWGGKTLREGQFDSWEWEYKGKDCTWWPAIKWGIIGVKEWETKWKSFPWLSLTAGFQGETYSILLCVFFLFPFSSYIYLSCLLEDYLNICMLWPNPLFLWTCLLHCLQPSEVNLFLHEGCPIHCRSQPLTDIF